MTWLAALCVGDGTEQIELAVSTHRPIQYKHVIVPASAATAICFITIRFSRAQTNSRVSGFCQGDWI